MIYFTSDLHLGHANIIKLCSRPFADVDEMNAALIANWNDRVTGGDTVYIGGDLMFRTTTEPELFLKQLKGKKHLIIGNHDGTWMEKVKLSKYFQSVENLKDFSDGKRKITLCHYPMMSFAGSYHIHGHIHNNKNDTYWKLLREMPNALNASVEINHYTPVTFDELVANNQAFKESEQEKWL
jgi:calcineurin-like phosphoesterase family protein